MNPANQLLYFTVSLHQHDALQLVMCQSMHTLDASLGDALHVGSKSCLEFTEPNFLSVGSQLPPRTSVTY